MLGLYLSLVESESEKQLIEQLYNNNKQVMYNIAFKNLHNSSDAEDAVHEAFLRAIKQIDKISRIPPNKQSAYMNVIVRNISFQMFNKRTNDLSLDEETEITDDAILEDEAIGNVDHDLLVKFIISLPQGMRDVLYLKYFLLMTNEEIEQALCISPSALRNRLFAARRKIKDFIENRE